MNTKGKEYFDTSLNILEFALKKWKLLFGVGVVAAAMAIVFSGPSFIPPKFTSTAIVYPANLGNYSGETRLEQMQQYLESNAIRDSLIQKFSLYQEYEIDSTMPTSRAAIHKLYSEHIEFSETEFESIKLTATSKSPQKAKEMVEEVIKQLDLTIRRTEREKYAEIVKINKSLLEQKKAQLDSLQERIKKYSTEYGILDYIEQSERVTEGYINMLISGKKGKDFEEIKTLYENLEKYGRSFHNMHAQLNVVNDEYMRRLHGLEHSLKDYHKVQTYTNVLVKPEVPDKKSAPIRWLIVVAATFASCAFTFASLLVLGYHNRTK